MAKSQVMRLTRTVSGAFGKSASVFVRDVAQGLLEVTHNTFAVLGLLTAAVLLFAAGRADIRHEAELQVFGWLQARQEARQEPVASTPVDVPSLADELSQPDAIGRATASDIKDLSRPQAAVALWLSRRYKVAPEPVSALVKEAWQVGHKAGLDPTLILAIMAVESSFNPFAQSAVGAQGLMQVMTKVHNAKYDAFGGNHAAFDPVTNLRVGVEVLKECISRGGSLEAGLRYYVGAGSLTEDGGYAGRVLSEQNSLRMVVGGKAPPPRQPPLITASPVPAPLPAPKTNDAEPAVVDPVPAVPEQIALLR